MKNCDFYERARMLGHPVENLKRGERIISIIEVQSLEELKNFVRTWTIEDGGELLSSSIGNDDSFEGKLLYKVMAYLYGNEELTPNEVKWAEAAFPVKIYTESAEDRLFKEPTELNTGEVLCVYNFGTVTLENQAYLYMTNGSLKLTMDNLVRNGKAPSEHYDFEILGKEGVLGGTGAEGSAGDHVNDGKNGNCSSVGVAGDAGESGEVGKTGGEGKPGLRGGDGIPSMDAEIFISQRITTKQPITVYNCSGVGGKGGKGGTGGKGSDGGKGGDGATCDCTGSGAGNGGNGGNGGIGGVGGQGGNGADAAGNVLIYVPAGLIDSVKTYRKEASPGDGGDGGDGGVGGAGGAKGTGGKHNSDGEDGKAGSSGGVGNVGPGGSKTGAAAEMKVLPL